MPTSTSATSTTTNTPPSDAAARGLAPWARTTLTVVTGLYLLAMAAVFVLVGQYLFGNDVSKDAHVAIGSLALLLIVIMVVVGLISRFRPAITLGFAMLVLNVVQHMLPDVDTRWIAGLHPLNAMVLFLLGHVLMRRVAAAGRSDLVAPAST